jgi:hypothetical protein
MFKAYTAEDRVRRVMLVTTYHSARRHIPEDLIYGYERLKTRKVRIRVWKEVICTSLIHC